MGKRLLPVHKPAALIENGLEAETAVPQCLRFRRKRIHTAQGFVEGLVKGSRGRQTSRLILATIKIDQLPIQQLEGIINLLAGVADQRQAA